MSSFAGVFREEIRRLARKEVRSEIAALKKASTAYRHEIADLKRQLKAQERLTGRLANTLEKGSRTAPAATSKESTVRFSPAWIAKHRDKLELSAADYAALVGVSPLTIYNWEKGKTRPRSAQLAAWAKVRRLGKREAWKRLDALD